MIHVYWMLQEQGGAPNGREARRRTENDTILRRCVTSRQLIRPLNRVDHASVSYRQIVFRTRSPSTPKIAAIDQADHSA